MAYDHQTTHVNFTILVVDDDPIFLSIFPSMLKNPRYKDKSFGEITVMTAKDSTEAISTLRGQCNKIDIVITDYHMPGLNGVQLKRKIDEEFGNLPVIVISADMNSEIERESLTSGAMCFMRKPINPNNFNIILRHASNLRANGGSRQIQETNLTNNPNVGNSADLANNPYAGESSNSNNNPNDATKKTPLRWTSALNTLFLKAIDTIGLHKAVPMKILEYMNVKTLKREQVASKLQKYRKFLKAVKEDGIEAASKQLKRGVNYNFLSSSYVKSQLPYNYKYAFKPQFSSGVGQQNFMAKNNALNSQFGYGVSQPNFMMNNNASKSQFDYGVGQRNFLNNNASNSQFGYGVGQSNFMMNNNASNFQFGFGVGQPNFTMNNNASESQFSGVGQQNFMMNNNASNSQFGCGVGQQNFMMNNNASNSQFGCGVGQQNFMMNNNASNSQFGCGVGQQNFMMNNNASKSHFGVGQPNFTVNNNGGSHDSIHYISHRPTSDLSQTGSELMPMRKSFGVSNGMLPLKEKNVNIFGTSQDSQAPRFRQYGTTSNVLGMNSNLPGYTGSNYVGIELSGNGDLVAPGGIKVSGKSILSLGEYLGAMNLNANETNMSNHGCPTLNSPYPFSSFIDNQNQPNNNFTVQTNGVLPVLENPSIVNGHHGINDGFNNTISSQFDQHHHQGEIIGENFGVSIDDFVEMSENFANFPLEDNNNWGLNSDNHNAGDGTLNTTDSVANSEMHFPIHDLNIINQELGVGDSMGFPLSFDEIIQGWNDEDEGFRTIY